MLGFVVFSALNRMGNLFPLKVRMGYGRAMGERIRPSMYTTHLAKDK